MRRPAIDQNCICQSGVRLVWMAPPEREDFSIPQYTNCLFLPIMVLKAVATKGKNFSYALHDMRLEVRRLQIVVMRLSV